MNKALRFFVAVCVYFIVAGASSGDVAAQTPGYFYTFTGGANSWPLNATASSGSNKCQWLYKPADFNTPPPAGTLITAVYIRPTNSVTFTFTNLLVRMENTALNTLTSGTWNPATTYYQANTTLSSTANGWLRISLQTPFPYAGGNFLFELSQTSGSSSGITINQGSLSGNRRMYGSTSSSSSSGADASAAAFGFDITTISTGSVAGSPFCPGSTVSVPFANQITPNSGNVYTAQLSNPSGSFANPVAIGTVASTASTDTIIATLPVSLAYGTGYRIRVVSSNPPSLSTDNGADLTINGRIYVDSAGSLGGNGNTWATAFKTVSQALTVANADACPREIWVRKGTYFPMLDSIAVATSRDSSFRILHNGIKLYGGFTGNETTLTARNVTSNPTILSGDVGAPLSKTDNAYHVIRVLNGNGASGDSVVIDGFTIRNGNANGGGTNSYGGGILANTSSNNLKLAIRNNKITENLAVSDGGGLYADGIGQLVVSGSSFTADTVSNGGGGGMACNLSGVEVANSYFFDNKVSNGGAGILHKFGNLVFRGNQLVNNEAGYGGGMRLEASGAYVFRLSSNVFERNRSTGGGGAAASLDVPGTTDSVVNNLFYRNVTAGNGGGGMNINNGTHFIINNTFYGDSSMSSAGGAIKFEGTSASGTRLHNNLFYKNASGTAGQFDLTTTTLAANTNNSYSTTNPLFFAEASPKGPDGIWATADDGLRLLFASPAVNAGTNAVLPANVTTDLAGSPRTQLGTVDIGAYEATEQCPAGPIVYVDSSRSTSGNGMSWATAYKTVSEGLLAANGCPLVNEIWVAKGTYYPMAGTTPTTSRDSSFRILRNSIKLYGGFPAGGSSFAARNIATNLTILSGDLGVLNDSTDNSYHVMTIIGKTGASIDSTTVVDGFTIRDGYGYDDNAVFLINGVTTNHGGGGGIYCIASGAGNGGSPRLANLTLTRNTAQYGGGLHLRIAGGICRPVIVNCTFSLNTTSSDGGAMHATGSGTFSPEISGGSFVGNNSLAASGGAIFMDLGSLKLTGIAFESNTAAVRGGAFYNPAGGTLLEIDSCSFTNMRATDGGAINNRSGFLDINHSRFINDTAFISPGTSYGGAITDINGQVRLRNSFFSGNYANNGGAMHNNFNTSDTIVNCVFAGNTASAAGGALQINGSGGYRIVNSTFSGNKAGNGGAASIATSADGTITNSIVWGNTATSNAGVIESGAGTLTATYNDLQVAITATGNISVNPLFANPANPVGTDGVWGTADDGLKPLAGSLVINAGDGSAASLPATDVTGAARTQGVSPDMGAYESSFSCGSGIVYVDSSKAASGDGTSWAQAFNTLAQGINVANNCPLVTEVWVAKGTYYPMAGTMMANSRDSSFRILRNGIKVYGGFPSNGSTFALRNVTGNPTIMSGNIGAVNDSMDNIAHVLTMTTLSGIFDTTTRIDGFTITAGRGDTTGSGSYAINGLGMNRQDGGGIYLGAGANGICSPQIVNCTVTGNGANFGGGLYVNGYASATSRLRPVVTNCTFSANRAINNGGAIFWNAITGTNGATIYPAVSGTTFNNNFSQLSHGGAVYGNRDSAVYAACSFTGNVSPTVGGAFMASNDTTVFVDCNFTANTGNWATINDGGAVHVNPGSFLTATGCTFTGNTGPNLRAGAVGSQGQAVLTNCTFTNNTSFAGGAVSNVGNTTKLMTITNCQFNDNSATTSGGALISQFGAAMTVSGSSFYRNYSGGNGGVNYSQNGTLMTFVNDTFVNNRCASNGGALANNGNPVIVSGSVFRGNRANSTGGGLYATNTARITDCVFQQDSATAGGGIAVSNSPGFYSESNFFDRNIAVTSTGAGINASNSLDTIVNSVFYGNRTLTVNGGGGIFYSGSNTAYNSLIANNTFVADTASSGGAIRAGGGTLGTLGIYNNISWKNVAGTTPFFSNNTAGTVVTLSNNFDTYDPLFVNEANPIGADGLWGTADDGLQLSLCSQAINFGINAPIALFATDAAGNPRLVQSTVDAGAYENQSSEPGGPVDVYIASANGGTACGTGTFTFTAIPVNAGTTPTYQWTLNGSAVSGATAAVYNAGTLPNGTLVGVTVTKSAGCSGTAKLQVAVNAVPVVAITSPTNVCPPALITTSSSVMPLAIQWNYNGSPLYTEHSSYAENAVTVAGGNGQGAAANQLNGPLGTFVDRAQNVYVAEYLGHRVTKWAPPYTSGVVVAGGNGAGAALNQLDQPGDIIVDDAANVYVADRNNNRVVKWAAGAVAGSIVAGGNGAGAAANQTNFPSSLGMDAGGNLYVTEFFGARVSKWAPGAGVGTVVAGNGTAGNAADQLNNPSYIWVDKPTGNVWVSDESNHRVQYWPAGATSGTTVAGGNGAGSNGNQLNGPRGIVRDGFGNLYVMDGNNARVQVYKPGAAVGNTVIRGNGTGNAANQFNFVLDLAMDTAGYAYVADLNNHRIQRFTPSITTSLPATAPGIYTATMLTNGGCTATTGSITVLSMPLALTDTSAPVICNGLSVNINATAGVNGNAIDFSGANGNYITIPNSAAVTQNDTGFTISSWIYPRGNSHQTYLFKGLGCSSWANYTLGIGGWESGWEFAPQRWVFYYTDVNAPNTTRFVKSAQPVQLNSWTHVAATLKDNRLRLYINGVLNDEVAVSGAPWNSPENLYLGQDPGCGGRTVANGRMDELQIWDRARTEAEIAASYQGLTPPTSSGLVGYWRFDESNGQHIYDLSPNGNHGIITGATVSRQIPSTAPLGTQATTNVTYAWSPAAGLNTTTGSSVTASPTVTTDYTITATNTASGCSNTSVVRVKVNPLPAQPVVSPAGPVVNCANAIDTLKTPFLSPLTYQWLNGGTNIAAAMDTSYLPSTSGTYTVRVTDLNGCRNTSAPVSVTINPMLTPAVTATANPSGTICQGTSVTFTASPTNGGTTPVYVWRKNGLAVGTNSATYTDAALTFGDSVWVQLRSSEACRLADTVASSKTGFIIVPTTIYVDSSIAVSGYGQGWGTAKKSVGEALALANVVSCPVQIWVKKGTYYPMAGNAIAVSRDSSLRIHRSGIKLYGGFAGTESLLTARNIAANPTILSGDLGIANDSSDNAYHVMTIIRRAGSVIDTTTRVDGFTITLGRANGPGVSTINGVAAYSVDGAGLYIAGTGTTNLSSPYIANCTITRNSAEFGAGAYCGMSSSSGGSASPWFQNCTFSLNVASNNGGALVQNAGNNVGQPRLINCSFIANRGQSGGAIRNSGNIQAVYTGCTFTENTAANTGGAIINLSDATVIIDSCRFFSNHGGDHGGAVDHNGNGTLTLRSAVFANNDAMKAGGNGAGGALAVNSGTANVSNTVFAGNNANGPVDVGGGAIVTYGGTTNVYNSTFSKNTTASTPNAASNAISSYGGTTTLNNSIVWGTAAQQVGTIGGTVAYNYSLVRGLSPVNAPNLAADPQFINAADPDGADNTWATSDDGLRLTPCSPAIGAGSNALAATAGLTTDITGAARVQLTTVDMGAYEMPYAGTGLPDIIITKTTPAPHCAGNAIAFSATLTAPGSPVSVAWFRNATQLQTGTSTTFSTTTLSNNDTVFAVLYNAACGLYDTSNRIVVPITPLPAAPAVISGATAVCAGVATPYSVSVVPGATAYNWTLPSGWTGATSSNAISVIPSATSGTITVTAANNCGISTSPATLAVTSTTVPATPGAISGATATCTGIAQTYTVPNVTGVTYAWTLPSGWSGASTTNTITATPGPLGGTVAVAAANYCGTSATATLAVSGSAAPAAPVSVTGPTAVCAGVAQTYSVAATPGATTYSWNVPAGWTVSGATNTNTITLIPTATGGSVSVQAVNPCGTSAASAALAVSSTTIPAAPGAVSGATAVCAGVAQTYTVTPVTNATSYNWTLPSGWSGTSATASISTVPTATGGNLTVSASNYCGTSAASAALAVTSTQTPAVPGAISGATAVCAGVAQTYTVAPVAGATSYTWTLGGSLTSAGSTTTSIVVTPGATGGTITVSALNYCGTSAASATLNVSGSAVPATPATPAGNAAVCTGTTNTYTVGAVAGTTTYNWTLPSGWSASSLTTAGPSIAATATATAVSGSITASATNYCGTSAVSAPLAVSVTATPAQPGGVSGPVVVCAATTQNYSITAVTGATSYVWTVPSGWTITTVPATGTAIAVTTGGSGAGSVTVRAVNTCGTSAVQSLAVTTNTVPAQPGLISGAAAICGGTSQTYSVPPLGTATSYAWTLPAGFTGASATTSINTIAGTAGGTIQVAGVNACGTGAVRTLAVAVTNVPGQPGAISGLAGLCYGGSQTYGIAAVSGATSYAWTLPGAWTATTPVTGTTIGLNAGTSAGGVLSVVAINGCGAGTPRTLAVNAEPYAVVSVSPAGSGPNGEIALCVGDTVSLHALSTPGAGVQTGWQWYYNGTAMSGANDSVWRVYAQGTYRVVATTANGCRDTAEAVAAASVNVPVIVNVVASPGVNIQSGQTVTFTATVTNGGSAPQWRWYRNGAVVTGVTGNVYVSSTLADGDQVWAWARSNRACTGPDTANSNVLKIRIATGVAGGAGVVDKGRGIRLYPNPTGGRFTVERLVSNGSNTNGGGYGGGQVELVMSNGLGQVVERVISERDGSGGWKVRLVVDEKIANGVYWLRVIERDASGAVTAEEPVSLPFVLQR